MSAKPGYNYHRISTKVQEGAIIGLWLEDTDLIDVIYYEDFTMYIDLSISSDRAVHNFTFRMRVTATQSAHFYVTYMFQLTGLHEIYFKVIDQYKYMVNSNKFRIAVVSYLPYIDVFKTHKSIIGIPYDLCATIENGGLTVMEWSTINVSLSIIIQEVEIPFQVYKQNESTIVLVYITRCIVLKCGQSGINLITLKTYVNGTSSGLSNIVLECYPPITGLRINYTMQNDPYFGLEPVTFYGYFDRYSLDYLIRWQIGDHKVIGLPPFNVSIKYRFPTPGTYTVNFSVIAEVAANSTSISVVVEDIYKITSSKVAISVNESVMFQLLTNVPFDFPWEINWFFNDGLTFEENMTSVVRDFKTIGYYSVVCIVNNQFGSSTTKLNGTVFERIVGLSIHVLHKYRNFVDTDIIVQAKHKTGNEIIYYWSTQGLQVSYSKTNASTIVLKTNVSGMFIISLSAYNKVSNCSSNIKLTVSKFLSHFVVVPSSKYVYIGGMIMFRIIATGGANKSYQFFVQHNTPIITVNNSVNHTFTKLGISTVRVHVLFYNDFNLCQNFSLVPCETLLQIKVFNPFRNIVMKYLMKENKSMLITRTINILWKRSLYLISTVINSTEVSLQLTVNGNMLAPINTTLDGQNTTAIFLLSAAYFPTPGSYVCVINASNELHTLLKEFTINTVDGIRDLEMYFDEIVERDHVVVFKAFTSSTRNVTFKWMFTFSSNSQENKNNSYQVTSFSSFNEDNVTSIVDMTFATAGVYYISLVAYNEVSDVTINRYLTVINPLGNFYVICNKTVESNTYFTIKYGWDIGEFISVFVMIDSNNGSFEKEVISNKNGSFHSSYVYRYTDVGVFTLQFSVQNIIGSRKTFVCTLIAQNRLRNLSLTTIPRNKVFINKDVIIKLMYDEGTDVHGMINITSQNNKSVYFNFLNFTSCNISQNCGRSLIKYNFTNPDIYNINVSAYNFINRLIVSQSINVLDPKVYEGSIKWKISYIQQNDELQWPNLMKEKQYVLIYRTINILWKRSLYLISTVINSTEVSLQLTVNGNTLVPINSTLDGQNTTAIFLLSAAYFPTPGSYVCVINASNELHTLLREFTINIVDGIRDIEMYFDEIVERDQVVVFNAFTSNTRNVTFKWMFTFISNSQENKNDLYRATSFSSFNEDNVTSIVDMTFATAGVYYISLVAYNEVSDVTINRYLTVINPLGNFYVICNKTVESNTYFTIKYGWDIGEFISVFVTIDSNNGSFEEEVISNKNGSFHSSYVYRYTDIGVFTLQFSVQNIIGSRKTFLCTLIAQNRLRNLSLTTIPRNKVFINKDVIIKLMYDEGTDVHGVINITSQNNKSVYFNFLNFTSCNISQNCGRSLIKYNFTIPDIYNINVSAYNFINRLIVSQSINVLDPKVYEGSIKWKISYIQQNDELQWPNLMKEKQYVLIYRTINILWKRSLYLISTVINSIEVSLQLTVNGNTLVPINSTLDGQNTTAIFLLSAAYFLTPGSYVCVINASNELHTLLKEFTINTVDGIRDLEMYFDEIVERDQVVVFKAFTSNTRNVTFKWMFTFISNSQENKNDLYQVTSFSSFNEDNVTSIVDMTFATAGVYYISLVAYNEVSDVTINRYLTVINPLGNFYVICNKTVESNTYFTIKYGWDIGEFISVFVMIDSNNGSFEEEVISNKNGSFHSSYVYRYTDVGVFTLQFSVQNIIGSRKTFVCTLIAQNRLRNLSLTTIPRNKVFINKDVIIKLMYDEGTDVHGMINITSQNNKSVYFNFLNFTSCNISQNCGRSLIKYNFTIPDIYNINVSAYNFINHLIVSQSINVLDPKVNEVSIKWKISYIQQNDELQWPNNIVNFSLKFEREIKSFPRIEYQINFGDGQISHVIALNLSNIGRNQVINLITHRYHKPGCYQSAINIFSKLENFVLVNNLYIFDIYQLSASIFNIYRDGNNLYVTKDDVLVVEIRNTSGVCYTYTTTITNMNQTNQMYTEQNRKTKFYINMWTNKPGIYMLEVNATLRSTSLCILKRMFVMRKQLPQLSILHMANSTSTMAKEFILLCGSYDCVIDVLHIDFGDNTSQNINPVFQHISRESLTKFTQLSISNFPLNISVTFFSHVYNHTGTYIINVTMNDGIFTLYATQTIFVSKLFCVDPIVKISRTDNEILTFHHTNGIMIFSEVIIVCDISKGVSFLWSIYESNELELKRNLLNSKRNEIK